MVITPVYSNVTWGEVVAVEIDGVTHRPSDRGPNIKEVREITFTRLDALPLTVTLDLTFEGLSLWKRLEHNGQLPDLTPIPEPEARILIREKSLAMDRLNDSFNLWTATGWDTGEGFRVTLDFHSPDFTQLNQTMSTCQTLVTVGAKQVTDTVPIPSLGGAVKIVSIGTLLSKGIQLSLIRQTANDRYMLSKDEIDNLTTVQAAQAWQPPAWEDPA